MVQEFNVNLDLSLMVSIKVWDLVNEACITSDEMLDSEPFDVRYIHGDW